MTLCFRAYENPIGLPDKKVEISSSYFGGGGRATLGRGRFVGWVSAMMVGFQFDAISAAIFSKQKKHHGLQTPFRPDVAWRGWFVWGNQQKAELSNGKGQRG